jgi:phospholipase/carboxylesterase
MTTLSFIHRYKPPSAAGFPTLLMLHGTGGNEDDLLPLASALLPEAGVLSPRGNVLERGMPRFFRRLAEGVFDEEDLKERTLDLAAFIHDAASTYGFDSHRVVAVGFSNGANIAASLLLMTPAALAGAVLFRAMVPFVPEVPPSLEGKPVLMLNGVNDPLIPAPEAERLAGLLRAGGAHVALEWQPTGHDLTDADVIRARSWLATLGSDDHRRAR